MSQNVYHSFIQKSPSSTSGYEQQQRSPIYNGKNWVQPSSSESSFSPLHVSTPKERKVPTSTVTATVVNNDNDTDTASESGDAAVPFQLRQVSNQSGDQSNPIMIDDMIEVHMIDSPKTPKKRRRVTQSVNNFIGSGK
jgi:hypothetical protein